MYTYCTDLIAVKRSCSNKLRKWSVRRDERPKEIPKIVLYCLRNNSTNTIKKQSNHHPKKQAHIGCSQSKWDKRNSVFVLSHYTCRQCDPSSNSVAIYSIILNVSFFLSCVDSIISCCHSHSLRLPVSVFILISSHIQFWMIPLMCQLILLFATRQKSATYTFYRIPFVSVCHAISLIHFCTDYSSL